MDRLHVYTFWPQASRADLLPWMHLFEGLKPRFEFGHGYQARLIYVRAPENIEADMVKAAIAINRTVVTTRETSPSQLVLSQPGRDDPDRFYSKDGKRYVTVTLATGEIRFENGPPAAPCGRLGSQVAVDLAVLFAEGYRELAALSTEQRSEAEALMRDTGVALDPHLVTMADLRAYGKTVRSTIAIVQARKAKLERSKAASFNFGIMYGGASDPMTGPTAEAVSQKMAAFVKQKQSEAALEIVRLIHEERKTPPDGVSSQAWFHILLGCQERANIVTHIPHARLEFFQKYVQMARSNPPPLPRVKYGREV